MLNVYAERNSIFSPVRPMEPLLLSIYMFG